MSMKVKTNLFKAVVAVTVTGFVLLNTAYILDTTKRAAASEIKLAQMMTEVQDLTTKLEALRDTVENLRMVSITDSTESIADTANILAADINTLQPVVPIGEGEEELLARLVIAESGNQPYEGQVAVAQVVCDRINAGYGKSISEVIYAPKQFAKPYAGDISKFPKAQEAVYAVLYEGARAFEEPVIFFCNPATSSPNALAWMRTKPFIGTIGAHDFFGDD